MIRAKVDSYTTAMTVLFAELKVELWLPLQGDEHPQQVPSV